MVGALVGGMVDLLVCGMVFPVYQDVRETA
jgi:hypothetical protein